MSAEMTISKRQISQEQKKLLGAAVHNHKVTSKRGLLERMFTMAFSGFVYPQIWEDPVVDMEALQLGPPASGEGCRSQPGARDPHKIKNYRSQTSAGL